MFASHIAGSVATSTIWAAEVTQHVSNVGLQVALVVLGAAIPSGVAIFLSRRNTEALALAVVAAAKISTDKVLAQAQEAAKVAADAHAVTDKVLVQAQEAARVVAAAQVVAGGTAEPT